MLDDLRALAVFAKTVQHGSFRAAAKALGLSPSVVSHHVSALERRLAVALLYRSTRHLSLTSEGERLLESARAMLLAAEQGLGGLSGRSLQPFGHLRMTLPAFFFARQPDHADRRIRARVSQGDGEYGFQRQAA